MRIVLLGAPGCGKGTQSSKLKKKYDIPTISTGEIFRKNVKKKTELGLEVKKYMDSGELVPDELVNKLVVDRIMKEDCENGYILDGYPRTVPQAIAFDKEIEASGQKLDKAFDVEVDDEDIIERMAGRRVCKNCGNSYHIKFNRPQKEGICDSCGNELVQREDDTEEIVKNRLKVYHKETQPIIDFYKEKGILVKIDGMQKVNQVFEDICNELG